MWWSFATDDWNFEWLNDQIIAMDQYGVKIVSGSSIIKILFLFFDEWESISYQDS
jgi:hypothetical protein